jgi:hypothetical protein
LNHIVSLAVTLSMVTADCADMFEQFQHVKQLNITAEITYNRKTCFTCMIIQTYIWVLGHIPVSLIKTAKYVKNAEYKNIYFF